MNTKANTKSHLPLLIAVILPLFTGYGGNLVNIITMIEIAVSIYYMNDDDFFLLSPVFIIYYSQLLLIGDRIGGFNIYMWLCCIKLFWQRYVMKQTIRPIAGMAVLLLYASLVMLVWQGLWNGINYATISLGIVYVAVSLRNDRELKRRFQTVVVAMCLSAAIYGILFVNIKGIYEQTNGLVYYSGRYCGTASDPNYMAFYYCISVVYIVFSKKIGNLLKCVLVAAFFFATAITGSLTALLTILATFVLYLFWGEKGNLKKRAAAIILTLSAGVFLYLALFTDTFEIAYLAVFKARIAEKISFLQSGDLSAVTSGRTEYSGEYIHYLFEQNLLHMLFGGYQLNALGLAGEAYEQIRFAAHNTYVDVLMTCGIVGLGIFIYRILSGIYSGYHLWRLQHNEQGLADAVLLMIAAIFIAGLSCFPSASYMLFLML